MSKAKFTMSIDVIMMVMCSLLVTSAAINEKMYDMVAAFKNSSTTRAILGIMTVEDVNILSNVATTFGSFGIGVFLVSLIQRSTTRATAPPGVAVTGTVVGLLISVALIMSGVVTDAVYKEAASFKENQDKIAKQHSDASKAFIALGAVGIVLFITHAAWKTPSIRRRFSNPVRSLFNRSLQGGRPHIPNPPASSVFFTY